MALKRGDIVIEQFRGGAAAAAVGMTFAIALCQTNGVTQSWITDRDYFVKQVTLTASGSSDLVLSIDNTDAGGVGYFQAANKNFLTGSILAVGKVVTGTLVGPLQNTFLPKGTKIWFRNQSVNTAEALILVEVA